jgi:hypothetical protein
MVECIRFQGCLVVYLSVYRSGQLELAYLVISRGIQGVELMQFDGKYMEPELTEVRWCLRNSLVARM